MPSEHPILYSFRRCPYAIRARLALAASSCQVELREVLLKNKPLELKQVSPKATVPVLVLTDGRVLDESMDIMYWALTYPSPHPWLANGALRDALVKDNDNQFKYWLDRYKYADRYPEYPASHYREACTVFLAQLEARLERHAWLAGDVCTALDAAVFPFLRQFSGVDPGWLETAPYPALRGWLTHWLESSLFHSVMQKFDPWQPAADPIFLNAPITTPVA